MTGRVQGIPSRRRQHTTTHTESDQPRQMFHIIAPVPYSCRLTELLLGMCPCDAALPHPMHLTHWQVQGCERLLRDEKAYYQRFLVCEEHMRCLSIEVDGRLSRFCQQCGKFEPVEAFDGTKRYVMALHTV